MYQNLSSSGTFRCYGDYITPGFPMHESAYPKRYGAETSTLEWQNPYNESIEIKLDEEIVHNCAT